MLADCHFSLAQGLPEEEYRFVRRTIIGIILATDMVGHAKLVKVRMAAHCTSLLGVQLLYTLMNQILLFPFLPYISPNV